MERGRVKIMSVLHQLAYLRRAKLERKVSLKIEHPSTYLQPGAQGCRILPFQTQLWKW